MTEGNQRFGHDTVVALADALKTPLLRLKMNSLNADNSADIAVITDHALRDIDALITAIETATRTQASLVPLSCGAIMKDVAERVRPYAKLTTSVIIIDDHAAHQPILGNPDILKAGYELIAKTMCDLSSDTKEPCIVLRADTRHGYPRLGAYRDDIEITADDVKIAKKLLGGARVNAGIFQQLSALRIVIAEQMLEPLAIRPRSAKSNGFFGLAFQLAPSNQAGLF